MLGCTLPATTIKGKKRIFKYPEKLEELCSQHLVDSTANFLLCLFLLHIYPCSHSSILFFYSFRRKLQTSLYFTPEHFSMHCINFWFNICLQYTALLLLFFSEVKLKYSKIHLPYMYCSVVFDRNIPANPYQDTEHSCHYRKFLIAISFSPQHQRQIVSPFFSHNR
jgi:hypothetical protein